MPHISLKMLKGRTDAQKKLAEEKLVAALKEAIGASDVHISMSIEDYTAEEWQEVYKKEITDNPNVVKYPGYKPEDLL
ncbi:MAG: 4-oxalocrotonate tautomerase [Ruminococcus sp.]|nr:4-oxalocrotonate tautomerase [Ruminococcus sp.]